ATGAFVRSLGRVDLGRANAAPGQSSGAETYKKLTLFGLIFDQVRAHYVEKPEVQKLVESAVGGMLNGLDPHSSYMNAKEFDEMKVDTDGQFGGLGMEVTMEDGVVKVVSPIDGSPPAEARVVRDVEDVEVERG